MIAKVENDNGKFVRWDDCKSACIKEDKDGPVSVSGWLLVCEHNDGNQAIYGLSEMDRVYFMNNEGRTIDQDCRMCEPKSVRLPIS